MISKGDNDFFSLKQRYCVIIAFALMLLIGTVSQVRDVAHVPLALIGRINCTNYKGQYSCIRKK